MPATDPKIEWWTFIADVPPDSSDSEEEGEWDDPRPTERQSKEYRAFCERMRKKPAST